MYTVSDLMKGYDKNQELCLAMIGIWFYIIIIRIWIQKKIQSGNVSEPRSVRIKLLLFIVNWKWTVFMISIIGQSFFPSRVPSPNHIVNKPKSKHLLANLNFRFNKYLHDLEKISICFISNSRLDTCLYVCLVVFIKMLNKVYKYIGKQSKVHFY